MRAPFNNTYKREDQDEKKEEPKKKRIDIQLRRILKR